jgi:hypothetical protein
MYQFIESSLYQKAFNDAYLVSERKLDIFIALLAD